MPAKPMVLGSDDVVEGRAFAHPDHVAADRSTLCLLIRDVHRRARDRTEPIEDWIPSPESWYRRVLVPRPWRLGSERELTVIGFFGRKREQISLEVAQALQDMSAELDRRIPEFEPVLAYSTHLLADERDYANLVLLDRESAADEWRHVDPHPIAAGSVSKNYYAFVRIYRGSIHSTDLGREGSVRLHSVKYWDFRSDPTWTAQRRLTGS